MKRLSIRRGGVAFAALLLAQVVAAGCNQYSYFEVELGATTATDTTVSGQVNNCVVVVSGATNDEFTIPSCRGNKQHPYTFGTFNYSTFADSGAVVFTATAYKGTGFSPNCQLGGGTVSIPIEAGRTAKGVLAMELTTPAACP